MNDNNRVFNLNIDHNYSDSSNINSSQKILAKQNKLLNSSATLKGLIESMPEPVFILNTSREIVLHNSRAKMISFDNTVDMIGKNIGEVINCVDAFDKPNACGGGKMCGHCGMSKSFFHSLLKNTESVEEVRVTVINNYNQSRAYNLKAYSRIIEVEEEKFVFMFLKDISSDKRRETLEKIFFHDALNTAGALTELITRFSKTTDPSVKQTMLESMFISANHLLNELSAQRDLTNAEEGNLYLFREKFSVNFLLRYVEDLYVHSLLTKGVKFQCLLLKNDLFITTDKTLLARALGNLVKNALEASSEGDTVKIYAAANDDLLMLNVYSAKYIHETVQSQIFKRSFTTKGSAGRGLGTYSAKLIIEQYLQGKVYFLSDKLKGTIFTIEMPLKSV